MNLNNIKYRLANLMRGRYGIDALYRALMVLTIVSLVLNIIFPSILFYALSLISAVLSFLRAFSKNHLKRTAENQKYLAVSNSVKKKILQLRNRFRDRNTHRYRACPSCRQTLRLSKKVGLNHIKCPVCKNEFDLTIRF
jgi:hypothetical protein